MAQVDTSKGTYLSNLFDPEVVGAMINEKLVPNIVFAPLATVDYTLQGRAGDEVTLPSFGFIGAAEDVAEGTDIPLGQLTATTKKVKIKKIGKAVQLTDEAVLSGYGDPINESVRQLVTGVASKVDDELLAALDTLDAGRTYNATGEALDPSELPKALALFGEEIEGQKAILVDPTTYATLLDVKSYMPSSDIAANLLIRGSVGMVYGTQIIVTERLKEKKALYIVKPGALALFMKRDTLVETDRDILNQSTVIAASKLFAPYLYRPSAAIKIKLQGE